MDKEPTKNGKFSFENMTLPVTKVLSLIAITVAVVLQFSSVSSRLEVVATQLEITNEQVSLLVQKLDESNSTIDQRLRDIEREVWSRGER